MSECYPLPTLRLCAFEWTEAVRCGMRYLVLPGHLEKLRLVPDTIAGQMGQDKRVPMSSMPRSARVQRRPTIDWQSDRQAIVRLYPLAFMLIKTLQVVANALCISVANPAIAEACRERPTHLAATRPTWLLPAYFSQ